MLCCFSLADGVIAMLGLQTHHVYKNKIFKQVEKLPGADIFQQALRRRSHKAAIIQTSNACIRLGLLVFLCLPVDSNFVTSGCVPAIESVLV